MGEEEFQRFTALLQEKLPVTFRVNPVKINHKNLIDYFNKPDFFTQYEAEEAKAITSESRGNDLKKAIDVSECSCTNKPYYPGGLLFEMSMPRELFKKNPALKKAHRFVQAISDAGLLSRQEIVSMLPPLLADVQHNHSVFDMCAAPGSKTT